MFQITAPVDSLEKIKFFEKLGVKDFFAGGGTYYDWGEKYNYGTFINRRALKRGNFTSIIDFKEAIDYCKHNNLNLALTFNHLPAISNDQVLFDEIKNINETLNPTNVIVYDYLATNFIDKSKLIHISNQSNVNDEDTFNEWITSYPNINRIIFPRDILLDSLYYFMSDEKLKDKEFEIFIKNEWCYHTNICTSTHHIGLEKGIPYLCWREKTSLNEECSISKKLKPLLVGKNECKLCSLHKIKEIRNKAGYKKDIFLKIPGRTYNIDEISKDILFVKSSINTLKLPYDITYKDFMINNIKLHKKIYGNYCDYNNCEYYEEVQNTNL